MHINVDKLNINMSYSLNYARFLKDTIKGMGCEGPGKCRSYGRWHKPGYQPLRVAQTLKWSGPGGTLAHYLPPKVVGKRGERKKRLDLCTIWLHREQVGTESSLKVAVCMSLDFWQGWLVWLLLRGGRLCLGGQTHIFCLVRRGDCIRSYVHSGYAGA